MVSLARMADDKAVNTTLNKAAVVEQQISPLSPLSLELMERFRHYLWTRAI